MPELLLNVGEGLTCLDQQTREGVAQGMRLAVTAALPVFGGHSHDLWRDSRTDAR